MRKIFLNREKEAGGNIKYVIRGFFLPLKFLLYISHKPMCEMYKVHIFLSANTIYFSQNVVPDYDK